MTMEKRNCGISMRLVPYGGGWTDLYADFGGGEIYFIISNVIGPGFAALLNALYYLHPTHDESEREDLIEYKYGICEKIDGEYRVTKVVDDPRTEKASFGYCSIPWKAHFEWDEEGSESRWTLEREPNMEDSFPVKLHIELEREETTVYDYLLNYEDLCYAVADACTKALKKHGFNGYHAATYHEDLNMRVLLFLKAVGLRNTEACVITESREEGSGETSDFAKEIELLLFDM